MPDTPTVSLRVLEGRYAVCRLEAGAPVPENLPESQFLSITRTSNELSIVCADRPGLPGNVEAGWRALVVDGPLDFGQVGILASLTRPLAAAGISIFALSTYDTDYLLLKDYKLEAALAALREAGHEVL